jgi:hypothetical protein
MSAPPAACALVILSCDAYRDLWEPCLTLYRRYWPDCPYPIFLVSETREAHLPPAQSVRAGSGLAWSDVARVALETLEQEYVLLVLDDFFLTRRVSTVAVEDKRRQLEACHGAYLRLGPWPRSSAAVPWASDIGEHEAGLPLRTSLQAAFWRRSVLLGLLQPSESPWDFERYGSIRSQAIPGFYTARRPVLPYVEVLTRGKWLPRGLRLCRREGLTVDTSRPVLPFWQRVDRLYGHVRLFRRGPRLFRLRRRLRHLAGG